MKPIREWVCLTDGRPWYKQVVRGLLISFLCVLAVPVIPPVLVVVSWAAGNFEAVFLTFIALFFCLNLIFLLIWAWLWAGGEEE